MKPTIDQLWNGELAPVQTFREHNPKLKELEALAQSSLKHFSGKLEEPLQQIFSVYNDCISEYIVEVSRQAFCDGFSLGMKLLSEALWENETEA